MDAPEQQDENEVGRITESLIVEFRDFCETDCIKQEVAAYLDLLGKNPKNSEIIRQMDRDTYEVFKKNIFAILFARILVRRPGGTSEEQEAINRLTQEWLRKGYSFLDRYKIAL